MSSTNEQPDSEQLLSDPGRVGVHALADQVMESIAARHPVRKPQYLPDQAVIVVSAGSSGAITETTIDVGSFFSEWNSLSTADQQKTIDELIEQALETNTASADERLNRLRLAVRTRGELSLRQRTSESASQRAPTLFGEGAVVLELVDRDGAHDAPVTLQALKALGISADEAFDSIAAKHRSETTPNSWQDVGEVWMSSFQDGFDFARLVIAGRDCVFPFSKVGRTVIAYAPSHSVCVVTDNENVQSLDQLIAIGDQLAAGQQLLSKSLWTLTDSGHWEHYELAIDPAAAHVVKMQEIRENTLNYAEQQSLLENDADRQEQHIASYVGFEIESGEIFSNTTYTLNQPTSLPKTDIVSLYDDEAEAIIGMLEWEEFSTMAGNLLQPEENLMPARFTLPDNLCERQIEAIRSTLLARAA